MISRRDFLKLGAMVGASQFLRLKFGFWRKPLVVIPGGTLSPDDVEKFSLPLVKPPAMPGKYNQNQDNYDIAVRQFSQRILSTPHPETTVWSYGSRKHSGTVLEGGTFNYPAFTIEANWGKDVHVIWRNELFDANNNYLPHLLPVDPTLHWANPPGGLSGRDMRPTFSSTPGSYTGPVPIVTHVHGAHTREDSDGYAEAWYLPDAANIPAGYARTGTFFDYFNQKYNQGWDYGAAAFRYPNDQRATTLWYHDHTLGMTRLNVYAGPAGFYLIRGGPDDIVLDSRDGSTAILAGPPPGVGDDPFGDYGEIPIVIQDRSFNDDGSLFYPDSRTFFDGFPGPYIPETPVAPIWNPEFFGNMMVVNGRTWPYLDVEKRRYRFRLLNGCNSRFLILELSDPNVRIWQIGTEGGFLAAPVDIHAVNNGRLLIAPAERADVIIDFSSASDTSILLKNVGPDEPFGGGVPGVDFDPSDPASTGQVMEFRVMGGAVNDPTTPPEYLQLPAISAQEPETSTQFTSLNEEMYEPADIPSAALLGTFDPGTGQPAPLLWMNTITENPAVGETQVWEMHNFTEDAHPIHIHLVQFEVVGREVFGGGTSITGSNAPLPWEQGFKDTVIAYPGEITRVKARFDLPGLYVWHCHIVEHEDNEMMRPYHVGPIPPDLPV